MQRNISGVDRLASRNESRRRSSGRNPRPNTSRLQPGIHRYPQAPTTRTCIFSSASLLPPSVNSSLSFPLLYQSISLSLSIFAPRLSSSHRTFLYVYTYIDIHIRIYLYIHSNVSRNNRVDFGLSFLAHKYIEMRDGDG